MGVENTALCTCTGHCTGNCNAGLGYFKDTIKLLDAAISYLKSYAI